MQGDQLLLAANFRQGDLSRGVSLSFLCPVQVSEAEGNKLEQWTEAQSFVEATRDLSHMLERIHQEIQGPSTVQRTTAAFTSVRSVRRRRRFCAVDAGSGMCQVNTRCRDFALSSSDHQVHLPFFVLRARLIESLRKNSPHTKVFNQCSNLVLKDAVKRHSIPGYATRPGYTPLSPKHPAAGPMPEPPMPGDIDCIIAGFPWYVCNSNISLFVIINLSAANHTPR